MPAAPAGDAYSRFVRLDLCHDYYEGPRGGGPGRCTDLVIEPVPSTAARLSRHGLLWRSRPDGLDIYCGSAWRTLLSGAFAKAAPGIPVEDVLEALLGGPLLFTLRLLHPRFLNITHLPARFGVGEAALCLSSRHSRAEAGGAAAIAIDASREIPLEVAAYDWILANSPELDEKDRAEAVARRPLPDAWCRGVEAQAALAEAAEGPCDPRAERLPLAYVELFLAPAAAAAAGPVRYEIRFAARSTRWLYVVADRGGNLVEASLSIVDPAVEQAVFKSSDAAPQIPGASGAYAFLSEEAVPLRQRPARRFVLKGTTRNAPRRVRSLVDPLPAPAADSMPLRGLGGAADVSEILVFV
ncbi:MAG: hypothetical protein QOG72_1748 [Sphingomonadales bacterium]|nr:hypothetical protein [Sphingomonadales bacterium]